MEENLAYCGLICPTCAIYLATREKDQDKQREMRAEIAEQIKEHYGQECKPEEVGDCDGCKTEGAKLFSTGCQIRICAVEKGFENCAYCDEYPCEPLEKLFTTDPGARERLDAIRAAL
ncbi:DUF3795 domain-containing protein [Planctomycetota bacterium]